MENFKAFQSKLDEYLKSMRAQNQSSIEGNQGYGLALMDCNKHFNGRYLRCLITAKKKIVDLLQENISYLEDNQVITLKHYFKHITNDNWTFLNQGILGLYLGLVDLLKKDQMKHDEENDADQQTENIIILRGVIKQLKPLLLYYFINRECGKRVNSISRYLIKSHSKISSQKKIILQQNQKIKKSDEQQSENEHMLRQIESQLSNFTVSKLIQRYLKQEQNKIIDSTQICRLCQQKIKLKIFQFHIKNCSKKTKLQADLKIYQQKRKQLYEEVLHFEKKLLFQQNDHSEKDLCILKILRMMKQAYLGSSKRTVLRRSTQISHIKKQPIEEIKKELQLFEQKYQKDQFLRNLVKNKEEIIISKRKLAMMQINSITKISSSKGSDIGSFKSLESSINNVFMSTNGFKTKKSLFASKNSNQGPKNSRKSDSLKKDQHISSSSSSSSRSSISIKTQSSSKFDKQGSQKNSMKDLMYSSLQPGKFKQLTINIKNVSRYIKKQIPQKNSKSMKLVYHLQQAQEQKMGLKQFDILKFLGKGAFGKVYLVRRKTTKDLYALKHIIIQNSQNKTQMQLIKNEHQIFKKIAGDHLIRAPFAFTEVFGHFFVLQFMPGGDLSQILSQQVYLEEQNAKFYLAQIILALQHLHNCKIIHRDLKPQNIVIDKNGHTKLTDFGLSQIKIKDKIVKVKQKIDFNNRMTRERANKRVALVSRIDAAKVIGTPDYIAPQIINQTSINNTSIDWWSLGVMAYEMIVGCRPFSALSVQQVLVNIVEGKIQWPQIGQEEGMMSPQAFDLISKLLDKNFQRRLGSSSIQQIKSHPFFESIDWNNVKKQKPPVFPVNKLNLLKQYSKLVEDQNLRLEIMEAHKISLKTAQKNIGLQNFVRYDFLLQQTCELVEQRINKQKTKFERIKTIGSFIENQEQKQKQNNILLQRQEKSKQTTTYSLQPKTRKISARRSKNVCFNIA